MQINNRVKIIKPNQISADMKLLGTVTLEHYRGGKLLHKETGDNLFVTEGLNHLLDVVLAGATPTNPWYVGLMKNNYTPIASNTAANALGAAGGLYGEAQQVTDFSAPATRSTYVEAAAVSGVTTNAAAPSAFTMANAITVHGAFLTSTSATTDTTGILLCAKKFTTPRAVIASDVLNVTYQITATSA